MKMSIRNSQEEKIGAKRIRKLKSSVKVWMYKNRLKFIRNIIKKEFRRAVRE